MKEHSNYIKYAGMLYLLQSILFTSSLTIVKIIIPIIGILLLTYGIIPIEERIKNKAAIIILAIVSLAFNQIAAVLLFLSMTEISSVKQINNNSPPEESISSESKRIDILLKIGLAMILVSGILFATTSWEIITDLIKVIVLLFMAIAFIGLSKFSEKKLRIPSTTKAYYILGLSFFLLTWVGICYFGIISDWFSYSGTGKLLAYFFTFVVFSINLYLVGHKFSTKLYIHLGNIISIISLICILMYFNFSIISCMLVLNIIGTIINLIPDFNPVIHDLKNLNSTLPYVFWVLLVFNLSIVTPSVIALLAALLNIINILFVSLKEGNTADKVFAVIISYILIISCSMNITALSDMIYIILFASITVFSLIIKFIIKEENKWIVNLSQILYHCVCLFVIFTPLELTTLIISAVYLIYNIISNLNIKKLNNIIDFAYNPIIIFTFIYNLISYMNTTIFELSTIVEFAITSVVYTMISQFAKQPKSKKYYFILSIISIIISFVANIDFKNAIVSGILTLLAAYAYLSINNEEKELKWLSYIFILLNINNLCANIIAGLFGKILMILILALMIVLGENKIYKMINYFVIVVPLTSIINILDKNSIAQIITMHIFIVYMLFLIAKFIIQNQKTNDIFLTVFLIGAHLDILFKPDLYIGIYIGILSIIIIFLTYNKEQYRTLFYSNIVIMIINIIIQLWEFWSKIPFWLYLLLVGISIVAFVTYKEVKKEQEPQSSKGKEIKSSNQYSSIINQQNKINDELKKQPKDIKFCPNCGTEKRDAKYCGTCGNRL